MRARLALRTALLALVALAAPLTAEAAAPSEARVAKRLAAAVDSARTDAGRRKAVLNVMRALEIGVVTRKGDPLVGAPEQRAARRHHLYDFELRALSEQLQAGRATTLADVAATLTKGGLTLDASGKPFPSALLHAALLDAVEAAAKRPRRGRALLPLLVRELGLRHARPYDLKKGPAEAFVELDALQAWLITADMVLPVLRKLPAPRRHSVPQARSAGLGGVCQEFNELGEAMEKDLEEAAGGKVEAWATKEAVGSVFGKAVQHIGSKAKWGIRSLPRWAAKGLIKGARAANLANKLLDLAHAALLARSMSVRAETQRLDPTHYLHEDGELNRALFFRVFVTMDDDFGKTAVQCGKLAGYDIPEKGGVPNVYVLWEELEEELTPRHGEMHGCDFKLAGNCVSKTNGAGMALAIFRPKRELGLPVGPEQSKTGSVTGMALYATRTDDDSALPGGGVVNWIAQFAAPKYDGTQWTVGYHRPRGYKFTSTTDRMCWEDCYWATQYTYEFKVCGENAYGVPWKGYEKAYGSENDRPMEEDYQWDFELTFTSGQTTRWTGDGSDPGHYTDFTIIEGKAGEPPRMKVFMSKNNMFGQVHTDEKIVPIQENLECPPLPDE